MSYTVIKTIRGRRYLYEQSSWREGERVRTRSRCVGALDPPLKRRSILRSIGDLIEANRLSDEDRALASAAREAERIEKDQRETYGETAAERAVREARESLQGTENPADRRAKPAPDNRQGPTRPDEKPGVTSHPEEEVKGIAAEANGNGREGSTSNLGSSEPTANSKSS